MDSAKLAFKIVATGSFAALLACDAAQAQVYYRVEVGYSQSTGTDLKDKDFANSGVICGDPLCNSAGSIKDVGSSYTLGAAVGYRFSPNLRADVALGYRPGYAIDATDGSGTSFKADVKSVSLMANGYYDFPLSGWTPYVGAGLGFAQNKVDTVSFGGPGFSGTAPGGTKSGTAYALMLGAGIPLSGRTTLDIGYRYIDLGKIEASSGTVTVNGFAFPYAGADGKLTAHELTVGLRF